MVFEPAAAVTTATPSALDQRQLSGTGTMNAKQQTAEREPTLRDEPNIDGELDRWLAKVGASVNFFEQIPERRLTWGNVQHDTDGTLIASCHRALNDIRPLDEVLHLLVGLASREELAAATKLNVTDLEALKVLVGTNSDRTWLTRQPVYILDRILLADFVDTFELYDRIELACLADPVHPPHMTLVVTAVDKSRRTAAVAALREASV
jgi:hypothetical protein